jgi:hypothetical protein
MKKVLLGLVALSLIIGSSERANAALAGTVFDQPPLNNGYVGGADPLFTFSYTDVTGADKGFGTLNGTTDPGNGELYITSGDLTVTNSTEGLSGTYPIILNPPLGTPPGQATSPSGFFIYDNVLYPVPGSTPPDPPQILDNLGLLFVGSGLEINLFDTGGGGAFPYSLYTNGGLVVPVSFTAAIVTPEPASLAVWSLLGLCVAGWSWRRSK